MRERDVNPFTIGNPWLGETLLGVGVGGVFASCKEAKDRQGSRCSKYRLRSTAAIPPPG